MVAEARAAGAAIADASRRARRLGQPVLVSVTRRAGPLAPLHLFAEAKASARVAWLRPADRLALMGLGAAHVIVAEGADRFEQVRRRWRALLDQAIVDDAAGFPTSGPVLLGGFSFDPLRPRTMLWDGFPDARMVLPERVFTQHNGETWLTTNTVISPNGQHASSERHSPRAHAMPPLSADAWQDLVGSVAAGIRSGWLGLDKVVLARAHQVQLRTAPDLAAVLDHLSRTYPTCTLFAFGQPGACFLGATPERLVRLHAGQAATIALAASGPRGSTPDEDYALGQRLLHDPKERREHDVVVRAIREALDPVALRVLADFEPRLERFSNVHHLLTRIRADVAPGVSILDLVERLHPTPALGGYPRPAALRLLRDQEGLDRGWYAAPLGWINAAGEGEFVAGIRSALIRDRQATLFTGCGIVGDSQPAAEYAESEWKLRPMLAALAVPDAS